jgi:hypothetical protein
MIFEDSLALVLPVNVLALDVFFEFDCLQREVIDFINVLVLD